MPTHLRRLAPLLLLLCLLLLAWVRTERQTVPSDGYQFCFWNVENLFDDQDDRRGTVDEEYDTWFAENDTDRRLKYARLSEALLAMNDGKGPDILALVEVESIRAAELLRDALNGRLTDEALHYRHVLMKEVSAGRHIAPALLTRLPVQASRTQLLGSRLRILETHVTVNDQDLVVIVAHWTSRVSDDGGDRRDKYADQIYGTFKGMYRSNPQVALLVCGDFNDTPDDDSVVHHLHASGDRSRVLAERADPLLFNLVYDRAPAAGHGTHYYHGKWFIFDQLAVSPAMLDGNGWRVVPDSVNVVNTLIQPGDRHRRPWRFGGPKEKSKRGYSDHFPVTVRLRLADAS